MPGYAPYYGNYMPNYYQPMQNQPIMNQPVQNVQQVPQTNQAASAQQSAQSNFFCRPVASKEEALAVPVDFMGQPMFFPDLAHSVIYMKRFNTNTGSADLFEFHGQQEQTPAPSFAPLDEFNAMKDTIDQLKAEIEKLKKPANRTVKKNDADE